MSAIDSVGYFLTAIQSGLVVSGNTAITIGRAIVSGDTLSTTKSGQTDFIQLRMSRDQTSPLTGGFFNEIADTVVAEIGIRYTYVPPVTSGAPASLIQRVSDFKTTIVSGRNVFVGTSMPQLIAEEWPTLHEKTAKARLSYRVRYLMHG